MERYLGNAFSIQMVPKGGTIQVRPCSFSDEFVSSESFHTKVLAGRKSIIGHQDLANILGVECHRENIELKPGDSLLVCQVMGGRLPEGTTVLPEGISLKFFEVSIDAPRTPWDFQYAPGSIYGAIHAAAESVATQFGGTVRDEADHHQNFFSVVEAPGLYAEFYDD